MPRVLPAAARLLGDCPRFLRTAVKKGAGPFSAALLIAVTLGSGAVMTEEQAPTLTAAEKAAGWKLLFDGKSLNGWRGWKTDKPGEGWKVENGVLFRAAQGGDLVTVDEFGDFELTLDWKIEKGGNSGIFFRVTQEGDFAWHSGPEVQILDNAVHRDGKNPLTSAGSNYAVNEPIKDVTKPIGEWNSVRLVVKGAHVEHWLNGVKVVEYEIGSPDWEKRVAASKFGKIPIYGKAKRGRIGLQDHGDPVWFRNVKIRPL